MAADKVNLRGPGDRVISPDRESVIFEKQLHGAVFLLSALITMLWGGTFLVVHHAMTLCGPFFFVGLRFVTAAITLSLFSLKALRGITGRDILAGASIGLAIAVGYSLQSAGMKTISSSQSAFITAMYVPLVPLLQWMVYRRRPSLMTCCGAVVAFCGLLVLSGPITHLSGTSGLSHGELITLVSTLGIAAEILLISHFADKRDIQRLTVIQLASASLFSFAFMWPAGESAPPLGGAILFSAGGLGIVSAVIQLTINRAQRSVPAARATIIYAGEPVWAAVAAWLVGERIPLTTVGGGGMILLAVLLSELRLKKRGEVNAPPTP